MPDIASVCLLVGGVVAAIAIWKKGDVRVGYRNGVQELFLEAKEREKDKRRARRHIKK